MPALFAQPLEGEHEMSQWQLGRDAFWCAQPYDETRPQTWRQAWLATAREAALERQGAAPSKKVPPSNKVTRPPAAKELPRPAPPSVPPPPISTQQMATLRAAYDACQAAMRELLPVKSTPGQRRVANAAAINIASARAVLDALPQPKTVAQRPFR